MSSSGASWWGRVAPRLRAWLRLGGRARTVSVVAVPLLLVTSAGFRVLGLRRTLRAFTIAGRTLGSLRSIARIRPPIDPAPHTRAAATLQGIVAAKAATPFRTTCLSHATVLWLMLDVQGVASVVRVGVALDDRLGAVTAQLRSTATSGNEAGAFAHAWVEVAGEPFGETPAAIAKLAAFDVALLVNRTAA